MIDRIKSIYQAINAQTIEEGILRELYTEDAVFIDPFHHIEGRVELERYFAQLYRNVQTVQFVYGAHGGDDTEVYLEWVMTMEHPKLKGGAPVSVDGITRFTLRDGKVCRHRDYFDSAQMLFENLPVLGGIVRTIKNRLGQ